MASTTPSHYLTPTPPTKPYQNPFSPFPNPRPTSTSTTTTTTTNHHHHLTSTSSRPTSPSSLSSDFRRCRNTRTISKRNPNARPNHSASPAAAHFLTHFLLTDDPPPPPPPEDHDAASGDGGAHFNPLLLPSFPLSIPDDYCSILHSLADSRPSSPSKAFSFFTSSLPLMRGRTEKGKLLTAAISALGKLSRPDLARKLFDSALLDGYGNTVFAHSAIVSAYARNGHSADAVAVFESMKVRGLKPNLISYNAVIDACVKGNGDLEAAFGFFREMINVGKINPDSKTFNSLLAGCSRTGKLDYARVLFKEMIGLGIGRDIYTYNTFIDAVSKCGDMKLAEGIMSEMSANSLRPNVVTFSTLIDGYAKLERFDEALELYEKMRSQRTRLDRVCYNTLLSIYVKTCRYKEIGKVCEEMETMGIDKDTVTYNCLINGYGKQGRLEEVGILVKDMRERGVSPSLLTYSTLIDIYSKAGLYEDAANVFLEFQESGLKADVVLYSSFIDFLAKNGLVERAVLLLDEMRRVGIEPNVVTYNTVIDGFAKSRALAEEDGSSIVGPIVKGIGQPMVGEAKRSEELVWILELFQRMVQQGVKPNVVTFSAILNACSRCSSFEDASKLLQQLRLFDSFVYGVAHGLLMGRREVWKEARSLFDQLRRHTDLPTSSAFYNALTDALWHFGQVN